MTALEWPQMIPSGGFKRGELSYHIAEFTPASRSKSWTDKLLSAAIAARCGGKTRTAMIFWEDECNKLFPRKQTKLLQSSSKQSRVIRVVVKQLLGETCVQLRRLQT